MTNFSFNCVFQDHSLIRNKSSASVRATTKCVNAARTKLVSSASVRTIAGKKVPVSARIKKSLKLNAALQTQVVAVSSKISIKSNVRSSLVNTSGLSVGCRISCQSSFKNTYVDKIGGDLSQINAIQGFTGNQKLYPKSDITISVNNNTFVDQFGSTSNLFDKINDGIFTGNYQENFNSSSRMVDSTTFIEPSSILTDGTFKYVCEVDAPTTTPKQSFLFVRAAAPMRNYASSMPPSYKLYNVSFLDPNGDTIVQYDDILIRGDSNYNDNKDDNFVTYISGPLVNNIEKPEWHTGYPLFGQTSGYKLSFDLDIICSDIGFSDKFNQGYLTESCVLPSSIHSGNDHLAIDGSPLSTSSQGFINPTDNVRISAIEIVNSGTPFGFSVANAVNAFVKTDEKGLRIDREILPSEIQLSTFDTTIHPQSFSIWESDDASLDNTSSSGCQEITKILRKNNDENYINLSSSTVADSGKLIVKFSHEPPLPTNRFVAGAFDINFMQPEKEFDYAEYKKVHASDSMFVVDEVFLKVIAKKGASAPDYTLDVVGYSFDHLLFNTPKVGGFLQNTEGAGTIPSAIQTVGVNDLGVATEPLSNKQGFALKPLTPSDGGDHYIVATAPVVNSTTFEEYIVPLKVYRQGDVGIHPNYNVSTFFENLFLDICPLPVDATIASVRLLVKHKPSNAMTLYTLGHKDSVDLGREDTFMSPSEKKSVDTPTSFGNYNHPLSTIENIPAGYSSDDSMKSNYSRRWRGVDGLVAVGPFDFSEFGFGFYNPQLKAPFLGGYFSFNNDSGNDIISDDLYELPGITGEYIGNYNKLQNTGLRFKNDQLFTGSTSHTTIDWTSITANQADPLSGQIADAFDNTVRVSGVNGYISFDDFDVTSGVIAFVRFSPDENMSFNSSVLFSKYNSGKDLEFSLGYNNGYLTAQATDDQGNLITIQDSLLYTNYSYPLSVVLAYNNTSDGVMTLYTDNEIDSTGFNRLRATSSTFQIIDSDSSFDVGYSSGASGGSNAFITDLAISAPNLYTDPMMLSMNVSDFLDSIHTKYWDDGEAAANDTREISRFIDKNTDEWHLGGFSVCAFDKSFDRFTERFGKDFITHRVKNDGQAYSTHVDSSISSDVDSDTSYHTQIENDFLRVNLKSTEDSFSDEDVFYSLAPRITKQLPRGYKFFKDSVSVDTIIEHITYDDIVWNDDSIGPKLIVSLYTTNKDNTLRSENNIGLINRSVHYIPPSSCIHKITSDFAFEDLINTDSEAWCDFDQSLNKTEFTHKFFAEDMQEMFLQYDIAYPSGVAYDSTVNIYGSRVKFEEPFHKARTITNL